MCFSATASYSASVLLGAAGLYGIAKAIKYDKRYLLFLGIPFFFAIQQLTEGLIWQQLVSGNQLAANSLGYLYIFFAFFFWPAFIPFSVYLIERRPTNKRLLRAATVVGFLVGLALYLPVLLQHYPVQVAIFNHSIDYNMGMPLMLDDVGMYFYGCVIVFSLAASSIRVARIFSLLVFIAIFVSLYFYYHTFTSVWCFFSGLVSLLTVIVANRLGVKTVI